MISKSLSFLSQIAGDSQHADGRRSTIKQSLRGGLQRRTRREDIVQKEQPPPCQTCPAHEGVADVAPPFFAVHFSLLPCTAYTAQTIDFRYPKPSAQQAGQHIRLVVASRQTAEPMQRHRHDTVHWLILAICLPGVRKAFRQKRRQVKAIAIFELMNPMPRLPFKGKCGNRKPPRPVIILQLALAAFVQQPVRRPATAWTSPFWQHCAFVQTIRAHLLFRRQ